MPRNESRSITLFAICLGVIAIACGCVLLARLL